MPAHPLSRHAEARANQRGVTGIAVNAVVTWGDQETSVGRGCTALSLSRRRLADRALRAELGGTADRLEGLTVVVSDFSGRVVTVLHDHGGPAGRRYRRPH